jgi:hypothetical protein
MEDFVFVFKIAFPGLALGVVGLYALYRERHPRKRARR